MHERSMRMSRLLLLRIALLSLLVLAAAIAMAALQAHRDVAHEAQSAYQVARLVDTLGRLQDAGADDVVRQLAAVDAILATGELRHLRASIRDDAGRELLVAAPSQSSGLQAWLFGTLGAVLPDRSEPPVEWTLQSRDGRRYAVTLTTDPSSEQRESLVGILDLLTVLVVFGALIVAATLLSMRQVLAPMRGILQAIEGYRHNDYSRRAPPANTVEMGAISDALNALAADLSTLQDARRTLSMKLLTLQEDERAHLARELHDEYGQVLTGIRADAAWLAKRLQAQPDIHAVALELVDHCERASDDVRALLLRLRPRDGDDAQRVPLRRMLDELVDGWRSHPGVEMAIVLRMEVDDDALPESLALAVYRISQEALTNAARHAQARQVSIELRVDAAGALRWTAVDDGVGVDADVADAPSPGNGLAGMRERVWAHGGEIDFSSAGAQAASSRPGLRIAVRFPPMVPPSTSVDGVAMTDRP